MREFELYGTVKAVVSICDSINYILEEDDLREVFSLVNNYLDPKGMFIFDLNTKYKYEQMGETTIAENREEASFIWDNYYDPEEEINEYELAIFIPEEKIPICTVNLRRYIIRERMICDDLPLIGRGRHGVCNGLRCIHKGCAETGERTYLCRSKRKRKK